MTTCLVTLRPRMPQKTPTRNSQKFTAMHATTASIAPTVIWKVVRSMGPLWVVRGVAERGRNEKPGSHFGGLLAEGRREGTSEGAESLGGSAPHPPFGPLLPGGLRMAG